MSTSAVSEVIPYLVMGESRRRTLGEQVRARIERWQNLWVPERPPSVRVEVPASPEFARELRIHEAACFRMKGGAQPALLLLVPPRCLPQIVGVLGDAGEVVGRGADPRGLAEQLETAALNALVREFRTANTLEPAVERLFEAAVPAVLREHAAGKFIATLVTLGEAKCPFVILLSPELVNTFIPVRAALPASERVERRKSSISTELVGVEAVLGEGEVSVTELARLSVGDVLVLSQKLGDPATLTIQGGARIVGAHPGRVDARRAIQIKGVSP